MIANERQYRITKAEAERFREALAQRDESINDLDPRLRRAMREGLESQLGELRDQLAEYEALREGRVAVLELSSLRELPEALIRGRVASGLSQKELAQRLGMKEQQLQRWEATRYSGISLDRIQAVAEALGLTIREEVILPGRVADPSSGT
jgi:ribosome-binding protein aMBF1 (putative translation factor)